MKPFSLFRVGQVWHFRFQVDGQRSQRSTGETLRWKAEIVAQQAHEAAILRGRGDEPCPTLRQLVVLWLAAHDKTASASHLRALETFGRRHLYGLGDLLVKDITTAQVEAARAQHLEDHARATANHWLANLTLLVNWARRRRMLRDKGWDVKALRVQKKPRKTLPKSAVLAWLAAVDRLATPGMARVIRLALFVGLRESEAIGARWEWLDWERRIYAPGKTKGKEAKPRAVPGWLLEALRPHRQAEGLICPKGNGRAYHSGTMGEVMRKANLATKELGITPHRLRGTYLTTLSELGVPIQDIQAMAGHADMRTTAAYLEQDISRVHRAQDDLGQQLKLARRKSGEPPKAARP